MIEYLNVHQLACLYQHACDGHVLGAGRWVSAGMVVRYDQRRGVVAYRMAKKLAIPDRYMVDASLIDYGHCQHQMPGVQQYHAQAFVLQIPHLQDQAWADVSRGMNPDLFPTCIKQ